MNIYEGKQEKIKKDQPVAGELKLLSSRLWVSPVARESRFAGDIDKDFSTFFVRFPFCKASLWIPQYLIGVGVDFYWNIYVSKLVTQYRTVATHCIGEIGSCGFSWLQFLPCKSKKVWKP